MSRPAVILPVVDVFILHFNHTAGSLEEKSVIK
jgi:hypothetical protein